MKPSFQGDGRTRHAHTAAVSPAVVPAAAVAPAAVAAGAAATAEKPRCKQQREQLPSVELFKALKVSVWLARRAAVAVVIAAIAAAAVAAKSAANFVFADRFY